MLRNLRQDFDTYRNTDNQKTKKRRKIQPKEQKETNKQTNKQTDTILKKQTSKHTGKDTQTPDICYLQRRLFFVWPDAMAATIERA